VGVVGENFVPACFFVRGMDSSGGVQYWNGSDCEDEFDGIGSTIAVERKKQRQQRKQERIWVLRRRRVMPQFAVVASGPEEDTDVPVVPDAQLPLPPAAAAPPPPTAGAETVDELADDASSIARVAATCLADDDAQVRLTALELLAGDVAVLASETAAVARCLDDPAWFVRRAAIVALSRIHSLSEKEAIDFFLPRLGDAKEEVRFASLQRLGRMQDISILQHVAAGSIVRAVEDESQSVRRAALRVLSRMSPLALSEGGGPAVIGRCLEDHSSDVRLASMQVLGAWGGDVLAQHRATIEGLEAADPQLEVRLAASLLLRSSTE
jgi:HEAT repeat protein